jgi:hypothetical protein
MSRAGGFYNELLAHLQLSPKEKTKEESAQTKNN